MVFEATKSDIREHINTVEEVRERIVEMYERGIRPVVTIKPKWARALQKGLVRHASWIPGFNEIVGTMGIEPYIPSGEDRLVVQVNVPSPQQIRPRLTGPDKSFHGVIVLVGPISPQNIRVLKESEKN